ncbi:MAG TPA: PPC domain-containing protein [Pyrinomonadaceae bacterium]|nr:PPC domain-containing protein [Pyrinomonadaceae bacterium]
MGRLRALLLLPFFICASLTIQAQGLTQLQMSTPIERTLGTGQTQAFIVTVEANNFVQFVVEQRGIDVVVRLFSPEGKALGEFDSPNGNDGPEHVSFVAVMPGTYRIDVSPLDPANASSGRYQIKILEMRAATEQEIKASENLEDVKAKGIALLLELDDAIAQIKSPITRINAQILASQLLWEPEQKRASKYLTDAANGVKELIASVDANDPEYANQYGLISQVRFEMTNMLVQRDPEAALSFLYSTVPPPNPYSNPREQASQESSLELSIANQLVQKDPNRALQLARKNLKTRPTANLLTTLGMLKQQNPDLAAEFANEIATRLINEKLLKNLEATNLAMGLLRSGLRSGRRPVNNAQSNYAQPKPATLLSDTQYRDLIQKMASEAFSFSQPPSQTYVPERDAAWNLLSGLQQLGSEGDNLIPGGTAAVEKKLNELSNQRLSRPNQSQVVIGNTPVDTVLEGIDKAPQEQREQLYLELAGREASTGEFSRARQIVNERVTNFFQRRNALTNMDQQEIYRAMSKGKVDEALRIISGFRTPRERAAQLAQIANQIGPGQKRANAINLLEQARAMLAPSVEAQDQEQMNALFEIARAFTRYDSKRSFEIVEPLIDQINELCAAARTLEGFGFDNFSDDELNIQSGNSIGQMVKRMSNSLGTLAVTNFERAKADADRLRLPEARLSAYLDIAQQAIRGPAR